MPRLRCRRRRCHNRKTPNKPLGTIRKPAIETDTGFATLAEGGNPMVSVVDCAMLLALPVMLAGENEHVEPFGRPVHLNVTVPVKPSAEKTDRVTGILCPAVRDRVFGLEES